MLRILVHDPYYGGDEVTTVSLEALYGAKRFYYAHARLTAGE